MRLPMAEMIAARFHSLLLTATIGLTSYLGDRLLYSLKNPMQRALADNLTHAIVGALSWSLVIVLSKKIILKNAYGVAACFAISSLIDLDHFLLAKSWRLSDASHLGSQRPILHCSGIPLFVWLISETSYRAFRHSFSAYYAWVLITGFISHHVRDATRRGMWFGFLGSTPPIPYYLYICIAMVLPYIIYWLIPPEFIIDERPTTPILYHSV